MMRRLNDTYTIIEEIGSGGGGVVYKAYHERLRIYVVAKQIKQQVIGRIDERAEADLLKRMKHTYLPRVYDFLEIDGKMYTVMDFIPGESLDKVLARRGRIPEKEVLRWARELSEALSYLHSQNPPIIHSDIKPANIMLLPDGNICLIDFNISLALDSSMKDSTGISRGYSPPEQYPNKETYIKFVDAERMRARRADAAANGDATATFPLEPVLSDESTSRVAGNETVASILNRTIGRGIDRYSDVYSLGATLYHLLTGVKPGHDYEKLVPIEDCDLELTEGFKTIISRMMELDPDKRYPSGIEVLEAFQNIHELDGEYRAWRRGVKLKAAAGILVMILGAGLTVGGSIMMNNETNTAYGNLISEAEASMDAGDYDDAETLLNEAYSLLSTRSEAYVQYTMLLYETGDYETCISYGENVLRNASYQVDEAYQSDLYSGISYILGNAYLEQEDYSGAATYLEQALIYETGNSLYYRDYAIALAKTGNVDQAQEMLENAISLGLGDDSIYMVQGEIAYARAQYEESAELLLQAINASETEDLRRRAVLQCDKAYRQLGEDYIDADIELLASEISRYGGSSSAASFTERLADAYVRKAESGASDEDTAQEYYQKALDEFRSLYDSGYVTSQLMENLAILYENLDQFDEAEEILLDMAECYPTSYVPYKRLAYLEADRQQEKDITDRDYSDMKAWYDTAFELYSPDDVYDQEMDMLEVMMQELIEGNWFVEQEE